MSSSEEVKTQEARFAEWVKKFEVYETMPEDELQITDEIRPFVWTEFQNDDETYIVTGYTEPNPDLRMPVVGYFISKNPYPVNDAEYEFVLSSMLSDCEDCQGSGENDEGEECDTCSGERGTYIDFSLK